MDLAERVTRLERSNRRWRLGAFAAAVLVLAAWGVSCARNEAEGQAEDGPAELLRVRRLEIVNEQGAVVLAASAIGEAGGLSTFDGHDRELVQIGALDGAGGVSVHRDGEVLARLGPSPEGNGALSVFAAGVEVAAVHRLEDGCGGFTYRDSSGEQTRHLGGCDTDAESGGVADE